MHVACPHIVMRGQDKIRQRRLLDLFVRGRHRGRGLCGRERGGRARDALGSDAAKELDLFAPRRLGAAVGEVDDVALTLSFDGGMRLLDETGHPLRQPVVASRLLAIAIHALLHHRPTAVIADDEAMQIKVETVLHGGTINFCDQAT